MPSSKTRENTQKERKYTRQKTREIGWKTQDRKQMKTMNIWTTQTQTLFIK